MQSKCRKKAVVCQEINKNVVFLDFVMFEVLVKNFKLFLGIYFLFLSIFSVFAYFLKLQELHASVNPFALLPKSRPHQ